MTRPFTIDLGWAALTEEIGVRPADILRLAGLPDDLFTQAKPTLDPPDFFRLWDAFVSLMDSETPGLTLGSTATPDSFSPPIFAAVCSPNLKVAAERLAHFKPLVGPLKLETNDTIGGFELAISATEGVSLPNEFIVAELVFFVQLVRSSTRHEVHPIAVEMRQPAMHPKVAEYFGCRVREGPFDRVVFKPNDAVRPFLTANPSMFEVFEPELQKRLDAMEQSATVVERLRAGLMEALPAGQADVALIAKRLGMSTRNLQRKLGAEGTTYQKELKALRERLARDYLENADHSSAEIAYLLGYEDPNSFIRAFGSWTGTSPEAMRVKLRELS